MNNENKARSTNSKHENSSSRRRRPATPQSPTSSSLTDENSVYLRANRNHNRAAHRRLYNNASTGGSRSYEESTRRVNSYSNHINVHGHRSSKKTQRWYQNLIPFSIFQSHTLTNTPHPLQKNKRHAFQLDMRIIFLGITFLVYTLSIFYFASMFPFQNDESQVQPNITPPTKPSHKTSTVNVKETSEMTRKLLKMQEEANKLANDRARARQYKTRPPPSPSISDDYHKPLHTFQLSYANVLPLQKPEPANPSKLCGSIAESNALKQDENKNTFPKKHVLNEESIVIITGILNPVGFHLALALTDQCKVKRVIGVDSMLPKTIPNRLDLMRKLAILIKRIPMHEQVYFTEKLFDVDFVKKYHPTHIIHLDSLEGSYSDTFSSQTGNDKNNDEIITNSYGTRFESHGRSMLEWKGPYVSIDQIFKSILNESDENKRPHLTYVSSVKYDDHSFFGSTKLGEELIANTYRELHGIHSVGLRLGSIFGPWCANKGTKFYEIIDNLVRGRTNVSLPIVNKEWTYVQDAVENLIATMQYRPHSKGDVVLTSSGHEDSLTGVMFQAERMLKGSFIPNEDENDHGSDLLNPLQLYVTTPNGQGLERTLAWHMNDISSPDQKVLVHADEQQDVLTTDMMTTFPCASECSVNKNKCIRTGFDDILKFSHAATKGCDVVLYSSFMGLKQIDPISFKVDAKNKKSKDTTVCSIAFISKYHYRVTAVIEKLKNDRKVIEKTSDNHPDPLEDLYREQNGKMVVEGFKLIWLDNGQDSFSFAETYLPLLSPSKLFHSSVDYALFVDSSYSMVPDQKDLLTIVHAMRETEKNAVFITPSVRNEQKKADSTYQRQYYKNVQSLLKAKQKFYDSNLINTSWILHSLKVETGIETRCEWYQEHLFWESNSIAMSFAFVYAKRKLAWTHQVEEQGETETPEPMLRDSLQYFKALVV